jgi:hypothetical protein
MSRNLAERSLIGLGVCLANGGTPERITPLTKASLAEFEEHPFILRNEVQLRIAAKDLRQQGTRIKRDGQTSPARDHRPVVGYAPAAGISDWKCGSDSVCRCNRQFWELHSWFK